MAQKKRIVVAMSGGVDSSVAAALLVEAGHEVIGVSMRTHLLPAKSNRACCTPDDMRDARATANRLGILFYLLSYEDLFAREVIAPFVAAYRAGHTPNPCVDCNDKVKFAPLLAQAEALGADALATGHYARLGRTAAGDIALLRAVDAAKDQTYFLYRLKQAQLARLMFPLGHLTKEEVRAHARRLGLGEQVAAKAESQEICFVGPKGYADVVERYGRQEGLAEPPATAAAAAAAAQGPQLAARKLLVNSAGQTLGTHGGVHHFTIGQRRGLGIAHAEPLYVTRIDAATQRVTLGPRPDLLVQSLRLGHLSFAAKVPMVGRALQVALRHRGRRVAVTVGELAGERTDTLLLHFAEPVERAATGQAAVLYDGDEVIGGGVIVGERPGHRTVAEPNGQAKEADAVAS